MGVIGRAGKSETYRTAGGGAAGESGRLAAGGSDGDWPRPGKSETYRTAGGRAAGRKGNGGAPVSHRLTALRAAGPRGRERTG